ncbi:phosphatidylethanolamine-binding protein [Lasiosphaeria miniovina]|uniref:Phosphatidylethanolamine-binding protein n=1 Tax=Lasiosphaeria miniovina TaxID=1954250 RepID=A0AA40E4D7_9PEZI|nr:phosphatidylethanolamine-binding protein [Lasiosphaeria miniovina]KAK0727669.1 phosphatidylethanolamine-binding protein [Lasiosphaeria miniovina]
MPSVASLALRVLLAFGCLGAALPGQNVLGPSQGVSVDVSKTADQIKDELKKAEIIPTVVDDFEPSLLLFANWSTTQHAALGNTIKPKELQDAPTIALHDPSAPSSSLLCHSGMTYTITLTDPDAPSRDDPKWSEMCHWIAAGVSASPAGQGAACSTATLALVELDEIMPYKAPGPPEKTGKHRYVLLAFAPQSGTTEQLHLSKPSDRQHWGYEPDDGETRGVRDWAKENGLVPVAANFIYSKHKNQ